MKDGTKGWKAGALKKRAGRWRVTSQCHPPPRAISPRCLFSIVIFLPQAQPKASQNALDKGQAHSSIGQISDSLRLHGNRPFPCLHWPFSHFTLLSSRLSADFLLSKSPLLEQPATFRDPRHFILTDLWNWEVYSNLSACRGVWFQNSPHPISSEVAMHHGKVWWDVTEAAAAPVQEFPRMGSIKYIYLSRNTTVTLSMKLCMKCIIMNILMFIVCYDQ